jgi:ABC-type nitrate/sulfonate/bicarbonate transport system permease component
MSMPDGGVDGDRHVKTLLGGRALSVVSVLAVCALWEALSRSPFVDSVSMVPLSEILRTLFKLILGGEALSWLGPSLYRLFAGYAIGGVAGVAVGLLMGYSRSAYHVLEPIVEFIRPIPSPAYIPIVILFLGIDDEMKIAVIALAAFFPVVVNTYSGVLNVDPTFLEVARTLGVPRWSTALRVVLPASMPYIMSGLRVSLGIGLIVTVLSEMVAGNSGIGYFVLNMQRAFRNADMFAGVLVLGILGYLLNHLFLVAERYFVGWSTQFQRAQE